MRAGRHTSEPSRHVYREQPSHDRACIGNQRQSRGNQEAMRTVRSPRMIAHASAIRGNQEAIKRQSRGHQEAMRTVRSPRMIAHASAIIGNQEAIKRPCVP